jgi:hypothetical protein
MLQRGYLVTLVPGLRSSCCPRLVPSQDSSGMLRYCWSSFSWLTTNSELMMLKSTTSCVSDLLLAGISFTSVQRGTIINFCTIGCDKEDHYHPADYSRCLCSCTCRLGTSRSIHISTTMPKFQCWCSTRFNNFKSSACRIVKDLILPNLEYQ